MKILHYEMFFLIFFIPTMLLLLFFDTNMRSNEQVRIQYNNALDHAVEDAIEHMVEYDSTDTVVINKDSAVENFYKSAYAALGISDSPNAKDWLDIYTPVMLLTDTNGFYIRHCYEVPAADGGTQTVSGWSEKYTYTRQGGQYILSFTISDIVQILDITNNSVLEGDYHDLLDMMPSLSTAFPFLASETQFQTEKHLCMSDAIADRMEYYINEHNRIADDYGIKYHFFLPSVTDDDWERAIDGISMMVIFQGYPYPSGRGYFNMVTVSGARMAKQPHYYIMPVNGRMVYHRDGCVLIRASAKEHPYDSARACAKAGAYPCNLCNP